MGVVALSSGDDRIDLGLLSEVGQRELRAHVVNADLEERMSAHDLREVFDRVGAAMIFRDDDARLDFEKASFEGVGLRKPHGAPSVIGLANIFGVDVSRIDGGDVPNARCGHEFREADAAPDADLKDGGVRQEERVENSGVAINGR